MPGGRRFFSRIGSIRRRPIQWRLDAFREFQSGAVRSRQRRIEIIQRNVVRHMCIRMQIRFRGEARSPRSSRAIKSRHGRQSEHQPNQCARRKCDCTVPLLTPNGVVCKAKSRKEIMRWPSTWSKKQRANRLDQPEDKEPVEPKTGVRDGVDDSAESEIVIGYGRPRLGHSRCCAGSVIRRK